MDTMKAQTYTEFGEHAALQLVERPMPKVAPGEVLVRVHAAGVNPVDWKLMTGALDAVIESQFPVIPGWDVAGTVVAKGIDAPGFEVGDEVIAYARKDWLHAGTFAEYVSVPLRALARKPRALTWEEAGGLPLAGLTAYQSLTRLGVTPEGAAGQTVLVHGASGGVGSAAVQIATAFGARVIGTASARNHDWLRSLGAEPVEYGEGLADRVRALAPEGVDVVVDYVGGVVETTVAVLAEGGRHASIADSAVLEAGGQWLWVVPDAEGLAALADLADAGKLSVRVAETFPLAELEAAFAKSREGHTAGKIVVTVA